MSDLLAESVSRLQLLGDDRETVEEVERGIAQYAADMHRDFSFRWSDIEKLLVEMEQRGLDHFDETIRLARVFDLIDKDGVRTAFERAVVGDTPQRIERKVEALIDQYRPTSLFTHHAGDLNSDHRRTHQAVITACRPQRGHPVRTLLCFELPSSTEWQPPGSGLAFTPHWFVDISTTLDGKLAALDAYADELRDWPHPRSRQGIEHLARWRGASVGCDAAEAFMLARHLQ